MSCNSPWSSLRYCIDVASERNWTNRIYKIKFQVSFENLRCYLKSQLQILTVYIEITHIWKDTNEFREANSNEIKYGINTYRSFKNPVTLATHLRVHQTAVWLQHRTSSLLWRKFVTDELEVSKLHSPDMCKYSTRPKLWRREPLKVYTVVSQHYVSAGFT